MPFVSMKIDGKEVEAEARASILGPIKDQGIDVPTLCHIEGIEPYGVCRLCIVEVKRGRRTRLVTSCNYPVEEGLEIYTNTDRVLRNRRILAELLLARSPDVREVREIAASLGVAKSRFRTIDPTDCVLCGRCVQVCDRLVGAKAIGFVGRGSQRVVGTPWDVDPDACIGCGACTYVCPTGVIQMEAKTTERWRREIPGKERLCRYARMGLISYKACPNNFQCSECEVDQRFIEQYGTHPMLIDAPGLRGRPEKVGRFFVVRDRVYAPWHMWVKFGKDKVRLGLDDFAKKVIGPVTAVNLEAEPGAIVERGDPAVNLASNGLQIKMPFPVAGKVLYKNTALETEPSLINDDCYDRGWLYVMEAQDYYPYMHELVRGDEASKWFVDQQKRLIELIRTDGGAAGKEIIVGDDLVDGFEAGLNQDDRERLGKELLESGATR